MTRRPVLLSALLVLVLVLLLIPLASGAQPTHIQLPARPTAKASVDLQEVWRRGGEDEEELLLGVVGDGLRDDQGNTYLLDRQLCQVAVIGPDGELVGTLGREGEGPGEFRRPNGFFLMDEGRLGIVQGFPGRVIILNADDTPGGAIVVGEAADEGGFHFMTEGAMRAGHLVVSSGRGSMDRQSGRSTSVSALALIDQQGREKVRFMEAEQVRNFQNPVFDEKERFSELNIWALGDGILYTHPERDEYIINAYDMTGELKTVYRRDFKTHVRSQEEKEEVGPARLRRFRGREITVERHILDTEAAIQFLGVGPDGSLYVFSCFSKRALLPEGVAQVVDVISPDGASLQQLSLRVPDFNPEQDRLQFLDGRHWLLIRNFDSAQDAMQAGFNGGQEAAQDEEDLGDVEPLEVVLYVMPDE